MAEVNQANSQEQVSSDTPKNPYVQETPQAQQPVQQPASAPQVPATPQQPVQQTTPAQQPAMPVQTPATNNKSVQQTADTKQIQTNVVKETKKKVSKKTAKPEVAQPQANSQTTEGLSVSETEAKKKTSKGGVWAMIILSIIIAVGLIYYFFFM